MNITKYLGIPFEFNRASFSSCDCAGLILLFLKHEFDIDLDVDISDIRSERAKHEAINQHINTLQNVHIMIRLTVSTFNIFDKSLVALFFQKENGIYTHCGVIVNGKALHAIEGRATVLTPISHIMHKELEIYELSQ